MAAQSSLRPVVDRETFVSPGKDEALSSGVSWAAVIGGAFVAASLSLILLSLGTGLGFSVVSPWSNSGASASTIGGGAIAWLIVTQIVASALGGYLGGRLRTKWTNVHTDEVYFRDTAHGLLVWAVGMVITVGFLTSAVVSLAGSQRTTNATNGSQESALDPNAYFVDTLLRGNAASIEKPDTFERGEVVRTFTHDMRLGALPDGDRTYLAELVSARSGLSSNDAGQRVTSVFAEAQDAAERARKALGHLSLWIFVALLSGAFCASYAGTIGGKQRDHIHV
jgi:hypothetical protein